MSLIEVNELVSVILPACNSSGYISVTLDSVLNQSYSNIELIVVDDGSRDNTVSIVESYVDKDKRVRLIELNENSGGPSRPRNIGLRNVSGRFVAFIDSDDVWHPYKLDIQLNVMVNENIGLICSKVQQFVSDHELKFDDVGSGGEYHYKAISLDLLLKKNIIATSSVIIDKSKVRSLEFSEQAICDRIEDYVAWLDLHKDPSIRSARLIECLVFYRLREGSMSRSKVRMALRIFSLLSNFEHQGKKLGIKRYYYFFTYLVGSFRSEMYS